MSQISANLKALQLSSSSSSSSPSQQQQQPPSQHPLSQSITPPSPPSKKNQQSSLLSASDDDDDHHQPETTTDEEDEDDDDEQGPPVKKPTKLKYSQKSQPRAEPPQKPLLSVSSTVGSRKPTKPKVQTDQRQLDSDSEGSDDDAKNDANLTTDSDAEDEEHEQDANGISYPTRRKTKRRPKRSVPPSETSLSSSVAPPAASSSHPYQPLPQNLTNEQFPANSQHPGTLQPYQQPGGRAPQGSYFYPYEQIQGRGVNDGGEDDVPLAAVKATTSESSGPSRNGSGVAPSESMTGSYHRGGYGHPRREYVDRPGYGPPPPQGYLGREYGDPRMIPHGYPNANYPYSEFGPPPDGSQYSGSGPRSIGSGYRYPSYYEQEGFSPHNGGLSEYSDDYSDEDYPLDPSQLPPADYRPASSSLLGVAEQARLNSLNAPRYGPLIDVPRKPPPPQTGLLGAITARERAKEANKHHRPYGRSGSGGDAQRERAFEMERERRLLEQRQSVYFDEMARRQQHMMGMYPPPVQGYGPYYDTAPYRYPMTEEQMMGGGGPYGGPMMNAPMRPYGMMGGRPESYYGTTSTNAAADDDGDEDDDVALAAIKTAGGSLAASSIDGNKSAAETHDGKSPLRRAPADSASLQGRFGGAVSTFPPPITTTATTASTSSKPPAAPSDSTLPSHPLSETLPHVPVSIIHAFDRFVEEKLSMKPQTRISTLVLYRAYVNWAATRPRAEREKKCEEKRVESEKGEGEGKVGGEGEGGEGKVEVEKEKEEKVDEGGEEKEEEEEEEEEGEYADQGVFAELMIENGFAKKLKKGSATVEEWYNVTLVK